MFDEPQTDDRIWPRNTQKKGCREFDNRPFVDRPREASPPLNEFFFRVVSVFRGQPFLSLA